MKIKKELQVIEKKRSKLTRRYKRQIKRLKRQMNVFVEKRPFRGPANMSGDCYWKNYANVFNWKKNYYKSFPNLFYEPQIGINLHPQQIHRVPQHYKAMSNQRSTSESNSEEFSYKNEEESESEEYEVTSEWLEYLEISMRHKEARRLEKEKLEEVQKEMNPGKEGVDTNKKNKTSGRDNIEECRAPKENMVDGVRIKEMKELYGNASPMILGMETAMQLTFNRNCDVYKPSYWPYLPLNLKFD